MKLLSLALLALFAGDAFAQQSPVSSIRVSGDAQVSAKPDRVEIDIGVKTRADKSQEAAAQNARQVEAVLAAVKKVAGPTARYQTVNYTLTPSYRYQNGQEAGITGYSAANIVQVTLDDLNRISNVIDAASQAGANDVRGIQFTLRDQDAVRAEALRKAAARARADADVLAAALGLKVVRVLSVEVNGAPRVPMMRTLSMAAPAAAKVDTPVESGTLEVAADVTLTVEVAAK
ncbi:MAG: SIMPL domain-containing protein [Proteobacteria bacterium]|nr:SIMPL domain-containing protein [Pseudomonadota bacterium]